MTTFLAWLALVAPSYASPSESPEPVAVLPEADREAAEEAPSFEEGVAADEEAKVIQTDGIWEWVEKLDGEIPTEEQLAGMRQAEAERVESSIVDSLAGLDVDRRMYKDPAAALYVDPLFLDQVDPSEFDIPIEVNGSVAKWVKYFTGKGRKHYARWMARSSRYRPMMYEKLDAAGLPRDLVYLSMIESGYNAHAYSHAHAAGLWQFIPSTGKLYKLRVDTWVDDRRDPALSTDAAIDFLDELHRMFKGDWRLAWASYNTGPGRVRRSMKRANTRDFWKIQAGPYLAAETDNYVPKIMAAAIIGKHPERYGFTNIEFQEALAYDEVFVKGTVEIKRLAKAAGQTEEEFRYLNPALRRYATPSQGYNIRVPKGSKKKMMAAVGKMPRTAPVTHVRYTVRRGDTLSRIAARHGVSVYTVKKANRLHNVNHIRVGMRLMIPKRGSARPATTVAKTSKPKAAAPKKPVITSYTVRKGDTLGRIASRHGTTVSHLRSLNGVSGSRIYVGQKLKVRGVAKKAPVKPRVATSTHTVRKGETLIGIANKYGTTLTAIQRLNGIRSANSIRVGQKLKVKGTSKPVSSWTTYTVRRGDSLGKIASARGCTVSQLRSWNKLRGSTIHPGQKLKVRR